MNEKEGYDVGGRKMSAEQQHGCPRLYVVPFGQYPLRKEGRFMLPYNF